MIQKVLRYVEEKHMLEGGDCVVAGVSGGADSVCLLFMLMEIRKKIPIDIRVVHINHLIRDDAAQDAKYVKSLCETYGISFTLVEKDVETLAADMHISTEEAGRNVRYEAFERELGDKKGKIAIAHNKNDCCETFLFNLFRGSSLKGLSGIKPVRERIIRPLMCLERREIEAFLCERNIHYCIDSTNLEDNYTRNKIRHHILERAVQDISPAAVNHISSACERINEAYDLIEDMTKQGFESCVKYQDKVYHIDAKAFCELHKTIQGYVVMEVLSRAAGSRKDLEAVHIEKVIELMSNQCGRWIKLPYDIRVKRDYTGICIYREQQVEITDESNNLYDEEIILDEAAKKRLLSGEMLTLKLGGGKCMEVSVIKKSKLNIDLQNIPQKKYTKWLDYDIIKNSIVIRTRKAGDYLTVNSVGQRKTLKAYFIDNKVPQEERSRIWLVTDKSHVMWIVGGRISSSYKVGESTENILKLSFIDEKN